MKGKKKRFGILLGSAIILSVLLAACGGSPSPGGADRESRTATDFQISVYQGQKAVGGEQVRFSELLDGERPVVLNLWAGLCPPCRTEMPDFQEVSDDFGDEVLLFGLDVGPMTNLGSSQDGQALLQELGITFPAGTTLDESVLTGYRVIGMPTTYLITADGEIYRQWSGPLTKGKLTELVEALLEESRGS